MCYFCVFLLQRISLTGHFCRQLRKKELKRRGGKRRKRDYNLFYESRLPCNRNIQPTALLSYKFCSVTYPLLKYVPSSLQHERRDWSQLLPPAMLQWSAVMSQWGRNACQQAMGRGWLSLVVMGIPELVGNAPGCRGTHKECQELIINFCLLR